jgi:hypothetical protein
LANVAIDASQNSDTGQSNTGNIGMGNEGGGGDGGGLTTAQRTAPAPVTSPGSTAPVTGSPIATNPFDNSNDWWDNELRKRASERVGLRQMRKMDPRYANMLNTWVPMAE